MIRRQPNVISPWLQATLCLRQFRHKRLETHRLQTKGSMMSNIVSPLPRMLICLFLATGLQACGGPDSASPAAEHPTPLSESGSITDHVTFFVLGKSWNFNQDSSRALSFIDMGYFAEIFLAPGGTVTKAYFQLQHPGAERIPFDSDGDSGAVLYGHTHRKRHQQIADLDAELPNGDYGFTIATPAGEVDNFVVTLSGENGATELPAGPVVDLYQSGRAVGIANVDPGMDVRVAWTPFSSGRADPNGISDDLIFVMMKDCRGERVFHSGRPLATPNPLQPEKASETTLTYATNEIVIPADVWAPGVTYTLDVEHARLIDTDKRDGVVGMTTYAVTTHVAIATTGEATAGACPSDQE